MENKKLSHNGSSTDAGTSIKIDYSTTKDEILRYLEEIKIGKISCTQLDLNSEHVDDEVIKSLLNLPYDEVLSVNVCITNVSAQGVEEINRLNYIYDNVINTFEYLDDM